MREGKDPSKDKRGHQRPLDTNNHFSSKRSSMSVGTKRCERTLYLELLIRVSRVRSPHGPLYLGRYKGTWNKTSAFAFGFAVCVRTPVSVVRKLRNERSQIAKSQSHRGQDGLNQVICQVSQSMFVTFWRNHGPLGFAVCD